MKPNSIDIFCDVIDNYGDIGVVYRFAKEMKRVFPSARIRVILNKLEELIKINKEATYREYQVINGIEYIFEDFFKKNFEEFGVSDIIVEAFGCDIFEEYIKLGKVQSKLWINLEYLSGEKWIEDFHLKQSLIDSKTLKKIFYMPGFSEKSGGILIDEEFLKNKEYGKNNREKVLREFFQDFNFNNKMVGTIFSYEKNFENLLETLNKQERETVLILMGEKTQKSFSKFFEKNLTEDFLKWKKYDKIYLYNAQFFSQEEYDKIISAVDFNFTRGEDSIVRALLIGKPFLWHIYLQEDKVHMLKLRAFLDRFSESISLNEEEKKVLKEYFKLLDEYNDRETNSFERGKEDFSIFFEKFHTINKICEEYSKFLLEKCNLTKKLYTYINEI
ncbi:MULTISPECIES: elongation factor P maturation arginine rhamnosyltransferase EarP [Fusobacterium]|uniref:elongation factor P maturation arginine rhamnosyltransferase EarP n=1 Tax=Fusobacterium TaxID=848 RepID=UPI001476AEB2|nr:MULTISPECIES: elongation factor P maturation arginine rhamnosyltransferase EarP [Fusobacterium]NME36706.1 elongation factor P maturation arginine rhamnosyltransferase EarP [Fusobacterium sp. FSA-380-WT-3A]